MAWVKLDDHFFRNPKVIMAGRDARDLYLAALCYCGSGLTDGLIPAGVLRVLGAEADIDDVKAAAAALVRVGLWHETEGGYEVHDYLNYNPTKERVIQTREARAEAGRLGGLQKASKMLEASQNVASEDFKQNPAPYPYPSSSRLDTDSQQRQQPSRVYANGNGRHAAAASKVLSEIGDESLERMASKFYEVNPQLDEAWLRSTLVQLEAQGMSLPPPELKALLQGVYLKAEDALGRENTIRNPPAWARKQIEQAVESVA
jgi:hypothetical protein